MKWSALPRCLASLLCSPGAGADAGYTAHTAAEMPLGSLQAPIAPAGLDASVIYEIFPRTFSAGGNFSGITARLDNLQKLGVNVLWLMPINPLGEVKKKGNVRKPLRDTGLLRDQSRLRRQG